jgi:diguanylate cyclase (GGDEF)-like protein
MPSASPRRPGLLAVASVGCCITVLIAGFVLRQRAQNSAKRFENIEDGRLAMTAARIHLDDAERAARQGHDPRPSLLVVGDDASLLRALTEGNDREGKEVDRFEDGIVHATARLGARAGRGDEKLDLSEALGALADMSVDQDARSEVVERERLGAQRAWHIGLGLAGLAIFFFAVVALRRLQAEKEALFERSVMLGSILESIGDAVLALDPDRKVVVANTAARHLSPSVVVGSPLVPSGRLRSEDGTPLTWGNSPLSRALAGEATDGEHLKVVQSSEASTWVGPSARPVRDPNGRLIGAVCVYRDISEQRRQAQQLASLSITDELTGLHNRRGFMLLAEQHLRLAARNKTRFALMFADLNGLKTINDTLGHDMGDDAIGSAARVLRRTLRQSDILARIGGDEFVALVSVPTALGVRTVEERILAAVLEENELNPDYELSLSLGISIFDPDNPRSLQELIAEADERMYSQKLRSRSASKLDLAIVRSA